jgi:hypothetical protein
MVAVTARQFKKTIYKSRIARNAGASYGYDIVLDTEKPVFEKVMGEGLTTFGGGLYPFGGELKSMGSGGLYPFGSGVIEMGTGLMPFGVGILSKLKGFAKKAHSVIKGAVPEQLRRAAVDFGKKKARELLPKVTSRVKAEIAKEAPGLVTRLTSPLVGKLPPSMQSTASDLIRTGATKGLSALESGLSAAESSALKKLGGNGLNTFGGALVMPTPVPSSYPVDYTDRQLGFMRQQGEDLERQRQAGNVSKRLVLDQHSRSLLDTIMADKGYDRAKTQSSLEQIGLMGAHGSTENMGPLRLKAPKARSKPSAARKPGRPKGKLSGKGIVYL